VLESGCGFVPWLPPLHDGSDTTLARDTLLTLLSAGLRGFNLYMAVERDRFYGAPIAADGQLTAAAAWIRPLIAALDEVNWPSLRCPSAVAIVLSRADARFALASSLLDPLPPLVAELGFTAGGATSAELGADPGAIQQRRWVTAVEEALLRAQLPYGVVDERCSTAQLSRFSLLVLPTIGRIDRALYARLLELRAAGTRVVIGPGVPDRDERGQPLAAAIPRSFGRMRGESLVDHGGLAADLTSLVGRPAHWVASDDTPITCAAFVDGSQRPRVLFVMNRGNSAVNATVVTPGPHALRDPFTEERPAVVNDRFAVALPALGVRMFVIDL
jgi:beta-galactosidase